MGYGCFYLEQDTPPFSSARSRKSAFLAGIFCSGLLTTATPKPAVTKRERASDPVRFLND
jgi:hypothetical protein